MKQFSRSATVALLFATASVVGCDTGKVSYNNTIRLPANSPYTINLNGPTKDQKVTVEASAQESFNIEVVLDENVGKNKPLALGTDKRSFGQTVVVPAGKKFSVFLKNQSNKETQVTVKANSVE